MFYHIRIDYFDKKLNANQTLYEYDYVSEDDVLNKVVIPYLAEKRIVFSGVILNPEDRRVLKIFETESDIKSEVNFANNDDNLSPFIDYDNKDVFEDSPFGSDVTKNITEKALSEVGELKSANSGGANKDEIKRQLIFISHASADKQIIKKFIDIILKEGLGLRDTEIACTSFEATGIKPGHDIPQYIKDNIAAAKVVLAMVSKAYKASEVCQNEVGAAWALNNSPIQVLLQDVDFDELGWLLKLNKASRIDSQEYLDSLEEEICDRMGLGLISPKHWNPCVRTFLESLPNSSKAEVNAKSLLEGKGKRANIQVTCEKNRPGQRVLVIRNDGDISARKVKIDVENASFIDSSRPSFPVVFPEIHIGDQRSITLALNEGGSELQLHISWEDDFNAANGYINTIIL